ncbi:hypothetical protein BH11BAC2_BH11BAC2_09080 [soil metagenome]
MKYKKLYLYLCLLTIVSCSKDGSTTPEKFTGYTMTDVTGNFLGTIDSSDWTDDVNWTNREKDLYNDYAKFVDVTNLNPGVIIYPAYPNPSSSRIFSISSSKPSGYRMKIRILDYNWKTLITSDSIVDPTLFVDLSNYSVHSDSLFRIYYMIVSNDSCFLKGHGDLSVKMGI